MIMMMKWSNYKCIYTRLQIKAYKIEVMSDNAVKIANVELAPKDTFYNNGSGTITKQYMRTRTITQTVEITDELSLSASTISVKELKREQKFPFSFRNPLDPGLHLCHPNSRLRTP